MRMQSQTRAAAKQMLVEMALDVLDNWYRKLLEASAARASCNGQWYRDKERDAWLTEKATETHSEEKLTEALGDERWKWYDKERHEHLLAGFDNEIWHLEEKVREAREAVSVAIQASREL